MKVLFLGPDDSPLLAWLHSAEEQVVSTTHRIDVAFVRACAPEFVVVYGYRHILTEDVLGVCANRVVNLHVSYLPWNRGADPNLWSFVEDTPKGVTIHYVDSGIDTGDVIAQQRMSFSDAETLRTSYDKLQVEAQTLFRINWSEIRTGTCRRQPQTATGTYHRLKDKAALSHILTDGWDTPVSTLVEYGRISDLWKHQANPGSIHGD